MRLLENSSYALSTWLSTWFRFLSRYGMPVSISNSVYLFPKLSCVVDYLCVCLSGEHESMLSSELNTNLRLFLIRNLSTFVKRTFKAILIFIYVFKNWSISSSFSILEIPSSITDLCLRLLRKEHSAFLNWYGLRFARYPSSCWSGSGTIYFS